jgi:hypothetical protein
LLTSLLSNLSSPHLELVAFHLGYWEHPDSGPLQGRRDVDALLQSSPFDGLKEVSVMTHIWHFISQCRARGILRTRENGRVLRFYGVGAGGLSETFECGLALWDHPYLLNIRVPSNV